MTADETIRDVVRRSGMTQQSLAGHAGVSIGTISRFLSGANPRPHVLRAIAAVFGYEIAARKPRGKR